MPEHVKTDTAVQTLDTFLAEVEKRAFRMARIATGNTEEALDIVQDAMLKLAQNYAKRPAKEWGPLFHRILQSRITDWYRRQKVRKTVFSLWHSENDEDNDPAANCMALSSPAAESVHQQHDATAVLEQAIRALPLRQQQAFLLRAWQGLDTRETAAVMACSEGSVKTHYSRAVKQLQKQLGDYWP